MTSNEGAGSDRQYRAAVTALILLILTPPLLHTWGAVQTARQIARRDALEENRANAQLGARLIDAQCSTALAVLRSLAERRGLVTALRQGNPNRAAPARGRLAPT